LIHIGTSGFSYKDWIGHFYPEGLPQGRWLEYYARHFHTCELNYTFYRMPTAAALAKMASRVPPDFRFAVKAFQGITHEREGVEDYLSQFSEAVQPLWQAGQLGAVLLQFPYSFHPDARAEDLLKRCKEGLDGLPIVVEMRNQAWLRQDLFGLLRRLGFGFCCVDEPRLPGLMPPIAIATAPVAYVRFHGRNAAKWFTAEEGWERYDYTYSRDELLEWVPKIRSLDEQAEDTYVYANNHWQGQATDTARQLRLLLESPAPDLRQAEEGTDVRS